MAGKRARQAASTRARIVETAERLFAARGYDATSLQAIADAVGIAKANVYYYFRTKADILDAAMFAAVRTVHDLLIAAARVPAGEERIRFLLDGYVELLVVHRERPTWVPFGPVAERERAARAVLEQMTTRALALVTDRPLTPVQRLMLSQVLALQDAVPRLSVVDDDGLRALLHRAVDGILALDPERPQPSVSES